MHDPSSAYAALRGAVFLDPRSPTLQLLFTHVYQQLPRRAGVPGTGRRAGGAAAAPGVRNSRANPGRSAPRA